jgi:hypothetical protein
MQWISQQGKDSHIGTLENRIWDAIGLFDFANSPFTVNAMNGNRFKQSIARDSRIPLTYRNNRHANSF